MRGNNPKLSETRLYAIWENMQARGRSACHPNYRRKGITVCPEWHSFRIFAAWALLNGYRENLTLDRIDNSAGYSPENCRWATMKQQARNKDNNRPLTDPETGEAHLLCEWAEITGLSVDTIAARIKRGWSAGRALHTPAKQKRRRTA